jgi:hypothetical protein
MDESRAADRDGDYLELKRFFEAFSRKYFPRNTLPANLQPLAALEALEKTGRTLAHRELRQMVCDCVEMSRSLPDDEVRRFDAELATRGIVGISVMRSRYSKEYRRILQRGEIRTEDEYRLVRAIADTVADTASKDELALIATLLRDYEQ